MRRRRAEFLRRLPAIEAQDPARRRSAERRIGPYCRVHRALPRGETAYLNTRSRYYSVFYGELEHRLRIAFPLLRLAELRRAAARIWARLRR
jgi:hypothetical protein